jgi:UDP-glucose 4-epimerase
MTKILITGGAGFIPSCLADRLIQNPDYYVVLVDNLQTGDKRNLPDAEKPNWRFIKADCNKWEDISSVMLSYQFDYVFHYAATVGVQRTLLNPVKVLEDIKGIRYVLDLAKNTGVKRMYFSSSSEVYGEPVEFPQNELTTPLNSRLPYAIVKNVGEAFFKSYHQEFEVDYGIFRFFNTYGPKQSTDFVISKFIRAALDNRDITVYGDGSQTRTFCYIDDNIEACVKAFEESKYVNDVMNVGNNNEVSILEVAQIIINITGSKSQIVHLPPLKEGDMTRRLPDNTKMLNLLGRHLMPLEEGLKKVIHSGRF